MIEIADRRAASLLAFLADDGTFTLEFIRPGEQLLQVAPFWLDARQGSAGTSKSPTLSAGDEKAGVDFQVPAGGTN